MSVIAGGHLKNDWKDECATCGLPWPCPPARAAFRQFTGGLGIGGTKPIRMPTRDELRAAFDRHAAQELAGFCVACDNPFILHLPPVTDTQEAPKCPWCDTRVDFDHSRAAMKEHYGLSRD